MSLALPGDGDAAGVLAGVAKSTRQRIRQAERDGVVVVRYDVRGTELDGFTPAREPADAALRRLLRPAPGDRGAAAASRSAVAAGYVAWWLRALGAGHLVYLEAREGGRRRARCSAASSCTATGAGSRRRTRATRATAASDHPGTMHLLRWRAIQLALAERRTEMDLGGVDVEGARRPPSPASPRSGCTSTSARSGPRGWSWRERRNGWRRPVRYAAGRATAKLTRALGRGRGALVSAESTPLERLVEAAVGREPRPLGSLLERLDAAGLVVEVRAGRRGAERP